MIFERITVSLPPGYKKAVDEEGTLLGLNRSEFIRRLIDGYLEAVKETVEFDSFENLWRMIPPGEREAAKERWMEYLKICIQIANSPREDYDWEKELDEMPPRDGRPRKNLDQLSED